MRVCVTSFVCTVGTAMIVTVTVAVTVAMLMVLVLVTVAVTVAMRAMRVLSPVVVFGLVVSILLVKVISTYRGSIAVRHGSGLIVC